MGILEIVNQLDKESVNLGFITLKDIVYLKEYNGRVVLLLNGGTKSSQEKDIAKAKDLWTNYKDELEDGN